MVTHPKFQLCVHPGEWSLSTPEVATVLRHQGPMYVQEEPGKMDLSWIFLHIGLLLVCERLKESSMICCLCTLSEHFISSHLIIIPSLPMTFLVTCHCHNYLGFPTISCTSATTLTFYMDSTSTWPIEFVLKGERRCIITRLSFACYCMGCFSLFWSVFLSCTCTSLFFGNPPIYLYKCVSIQLLNGSINNW